MMTTPNDTTIAAMNEDRDGLEMVESVKELFQRLHDESPDKINIGSKTMMTHADRQAMRQPVFTVTREYLSTTTLESIG